MTTKTLVVSESFNPEEVAWQTVARRILATTLDTLGSCTFFELRLALPTEMGTSQVVGSFKWDGDQGGLDVIYLWKGEPLPPFDPKPVWQAAGGYWLVGPTFMVCAPPVVQ